MSGLELENLATTVVHAAYQIHRGLGPGLLESFYETLLTKRLLEQGLDVRTQVPMSFEFEGIHFEHGFRLDLLVSRSLIVEIKSVDRLIPVHSTQLLTYLRLAHFPLGLLLNFGSPMFSDGCKRVTNRYYASPDIKASWTNRPGD